ncbi:tetratricopeptide repeat protein [Streptomyces sp. NRRL B-24484]|uniref:tetratricopeptide repeat protein n=1 Tax=Streptomyces sp. NRRL B-24484 TaxID=1463833 RepID=UPI000693FD44|nr:tetratricopeptide repeat protein [Streptomyces sp. NRRL B-24484]
MGHDMLGNAIGAGSTANYTHIEQQTVITAPPGLHPLAGSGLHPSSEGAAPAPLAPPPRVPEGFTGRDEELEDLLALLDPSPSAEREGGRAVVVASVLGMGGMGKTTLALAAGHAALKHGLFTGVLFLDLHGYDDNTLDTDQALDAALRALGTDPERIPAGTDQRAALYRSQLAARTRAGERVLVLADNACGAGQVEHLVPVGGPHRLLVTSRDDFAAILGARLVDLDVLDPARSIALMDTALHITLPEDGRIAADPEGAARVVKLCGHLPLALRIATAQLAADRFLAPGQLAQDLEDLGERLDVLEDGPRAVRTVLERSYRRLSPTHAELFRLLTVNPGPDLSTDSITVLTGIGKPREVRTGLVALSRASLVRQDPATGRWRMHDLVRAYATEQADTHPDRASVALRRLLEHYACSTWNADAFLGPRVSGGSRGLQFEDRAEALAWLDTERANLTAAVHTAHATGHLDVTQYLASYLGPYLNLRRLLEDHQDVARAALAAVQTGSDPNAEAAAWGSLGLALNDLRHFEEAEHAHRTALRQFQALNDQHGAALVWGNLGIALEGLRRFEEAEHAYRSSLRQLQALKDQHGETNAWTNLGSVLSEMRRFEEAEHACRTAIHQFEARSDHHRAALVWGNLGLTLKWLRRFEEAEDACRTAIHQFRIFDDQRGEAIAWTNLGDTLTELRRFEEAEHAYRTALHQFRIVDDQRGEAAAWTGIGIALRGVGEPTGAREAGEQAVALFHGLDDQCRLGEALDELADTLLAAGRPADEVRAMREKSATAYRAAGANDEAQKALEKADQ